MLTESVTVPTKSLEVTVKDVQSCKDAFLSKLKLDKDASVELVNVEFNYGQSLTCTFSVETPVIVDATPEQIEASKAIPKPKPGPK